VLSKKLENALNQQINSEFYSFYLYFSIEAYFQQQNLQGFAKWMRAQAKEELQHCEKLYEYMHARQGSVVLAAVDAPPAKWSSPLKAFEAALKHEQDVTKMINKLVDLAVSEKDHATHIFLHWFVEEQVEEEATIGLVVEKLKLVGSSTSGLYMLDRELAQRPAA
jgi:ferritin